jgi:hypothetical protein
MAWRPCGRHLLCDLHPHRPPCTVGLPLAGPPRVRPRVLCVATLSLLRSILPPPRVRPRSAPVRLALSQSRVRPARCALLLRALPQLLVAPNLASVLSLRALPIPRGSNPNRRHRPSSFVLHSLATLQAATSMSSPAPSTRRRRPGGDGGLLDGNSTKPHGLPPPWTIATSTPPHSGPPSTPLPPRLPPASVAVPSDGNTAVRCCSQYRGKVLQPTRPF